MRFVGAATRDEALRIVAGAEAACSRATGRTCRTPRWRRCRSACPWSRRPSAACPRSSRDGENGLLVPPGDPEAFAAAVRRILEEPGLRDRLAAAAKPSVEALSSDIVYGKLEALLSEAVR